MTIIAKKRGELLDINDVARLLIHLKDQFGNDVNADSTPSIAIMQPGGMIYLNNSSNGVIQNSDHTGALLTGQYYYDFTVPFNGPYGAWNDIWTSNVQGYVLTQTFTFIVTGTQIPENPSSDGLMHLGDDVPFEYSQEAIYNINKMIKMMKERLNSDGKSLSKDAYGNTTYITCSNFSVNTLVTFLGMSLSHFNLVPYATYFTFDDSEFIAEYCEIIVQLAMTFALYSKSLIEKGSEFTISDNGISFTPAQVADFIKGNADTVFAAYTETLKNVKNTMRPLPLSLTTFDISTSGKSGIYKALSRRREGRIV